MIVIPTGVTAIDGRSLKNVLIGYQTYTFDLTASAVTASDTDDGPADAPLRPDTGEFWEPVSLPATWVLDLGQARTIDYLGIAGHTLGTCGCTIDVDAYTEDLDAYVRLPGVAGNYISTPNSAEYGVAALGSFELEWWGAADDWTPSTSQVLASKLASEAGADQSWYLMLRTDGKLRFRASTDGTNAVNNESTDSVTAADGEKIGIKVTYNSVGGSPSDALITFYTAVDEGNPDWEQLGDPVEFSGGGSLAGSTVPIELGSRNGGLTAPFAGKIYRFIFRHNIDGDTTLDFDASNAATGATVVNRGSPGETWTINASGSPNAYLLNNEASIGFSDSHVPTDDSAIVCLDTPRSARYVRLNISGSGDVPRIAVIYVGEVLATETAILGSGHTPPNLSRQTELHRSLSRGGQFLGQTYRRNGLTGSVSLQYLDPDWYRTDFDPFVEHARRYPYFLGWRPDTHPAEVVYAWTPDDIVPSYMGILNLMQVSFALQAIGSE